MVDPGGDLGMQNSIVRLENANSFNQGRLLNSSCVCVDDVLDLFEKVFELLVYVWKCWGKMKQLIF